MNVQENDQEQVTVCALYHFARIDSPETLQSELLSLLLAQGIKGTLLVAQEGINGTVAGAHAAIAVLKQYIADDGRFDGIVYKEAMSLKMPFLRSRVKLKREIVTMGVPDIDPRQIKGTYVKPADWNELINDPDVTVIDTRNQYEVEIGSFKGAINPQTTSFREFPEYVRETLDPNKHKKVAMFCTGGIRCEKSTAFLKSQGFDEVYHLEGGILKYLEEVPADNSLWEGECFVFDERVTVDHNLAPGSYEQCNACRMPVSDEDMALASFVKGVSCPYCIDTKSDADRARFRERQKQIQLAAERGESHLGSEAATSQKARTKQKKALKQAQSNQDATPGG